MNFSACTGLFVLFLLATLCGSSAFTIGHVARNSVAASTRLSRCPTCTKTTYKFRLLSAGSSKQEWECGDVYKDLDRLEQAINFTNAEEDLHSKERLEKLQHFAKARHPLFPTLLRFILLPFAAAVFLHKCLAYKAVSTLLHIATGIMDFHFWGVVVVMPIALLAMKRLHKSPADPMPEELKDLAPEYLPFVSTDWEPEKTSCRDPVLFILEYWASSVTGIAVLGMARSLFTRWRPHHNSMVVSLWWNCAQCLTRIGAMAAIQQYPRQVYQLERLKQPRPIGFFPMLLQKLVMNLRLALPFGLTTDLVQVFSCLTPNVLTAITSSVATLGVGVWIRLRQGSEDGGFSKLSRLSPSQRLLYSMSTFTLWRKPIGNLVSKLRATPASAVFGYFEIAPLLISLICLARVALGCLPLIGPVIHLAAIRKLIRIIHTHDLSLALDIEDFEAALKNEETMATRMKWRYRLEWRDDRRLSVHLEEWRRGWLYWLRSKGSVNEKLLMEARESQKKAELQGEMILDKLQRELEDTPNGIEDFIPREQWQQDAMERLAQKHQEDYNRKDFEDPLGVAIYRAFNIGLGFQFDYDRPLEPGERPSLRRLQARAAKSAMKRARDLYDAEQAASELDKTSTPDERRARARELRKQTEDEIKFLAKRLTELVPPRDQDQSEFSGRFLFQKYKEKQNYSKMTNELLEDDPFRPVSSIEQLWADTPPQNSEAFVGESEDEFLDAYAKQRYGLDSGDEDEEDGPQILLA